MRPSFDTIMRRARITLYGFHAAAHFVLWFSTGICLLAFTKIDWTDPPDFLANGVLWGLGVGVPLGSLHAVMIEKHARSYLDYVAGGMLAMFYMVISCFVLGFVVLFAHFGFEATFNYASPREDNYGSTKQMTIFGLMLVFTGLWMNVPIPKALEVVQQRFMMQSRQRV